MRIAVLDIGSNTVRLMARQVEPGGRSRDLLNLGRTTRLGRGLGASGRIAPESIDATVSTVAEFVERARQLGVRRIEAVGTEALRRAANGSEVLQRIRAASGVAVRILTGEAEAALSLRAQDDVEVDDLVVVDIGGGSSEWIRGNPRTGELIRVVSLPLGAVGLTERFFGGDTVSEEELEAARRHVDGVLAEALADPDCGTNRPRAVGGTATTTAAINLRLATYDPRLIQGLVLSRAIVEGMLERVAAMDLETRKQLPGLSPARADIMPAGLVIFARLMAWCDWREVEISARGIRHGLLAEMSSAAAPSES